MPRWKIVDKCDSADAAIFGRVVPDSDVAYDEKLKSDVTRCTYCTDKCKVKVKKL